MGDRKASAHRVAHLRIAQTPFLAALLILFAVTLLAPISTTLQGAGPMIVNTTLDETTSGDGLCSLREAINNANSPGSDTTGGDCVVGTGADTINFSVSGTIILVGSGLPVIQNSLTIDGTGQAITVDGASRFQVLAVNSGATLVLDHLTVARGIGIDGDPGGGVANSGTLTVNNSIFSGNSDDLGGGAIHSSGTLSITNSTFSGNRANGDGGAIEVDRGAVTVANSTFSGNFVGGNGGDIRNDAGTVRVANSTFSGNFAGGNGGGIFNNDLGSLLVTNSSFSANSATGTGGGIFSNASATVSNSILAASRGGNCSGSITNGGSNISDDATCGFGTGTGTNGKTLGDNVNPLLDPSGLQDNGGPTETIALQSNSPAIDAVPVAQCPATDQRGFRRPDPEDSGSANPACDIGAFESAAIATPATATPSGTPTATPTPTQTPTPAPVPATLNVGPNPLLLGRHKVGSRTTKSVKVQALRSNRAPVVIEGFSVSSATGDYNVNSGKTTCTPGKLLLPRSSCAIGIDFIPSMKTKGQSDLGQLQVQTNAEVIKPKPPPVVLKGGGK